MIQSFCVCLLHHAELEQQNVGKHWIDPQAVDVCVLVFVFVYISVIITLLKFYMILNLCFNSSNMVYFSTPSSPPKLWEINFSNWELFFFTYNVLNAVDG